MQDAIQLTQLELQAKVQAYQHELTNFQEAMSDPKLSNSENYLAMTAQFIKRMGPLLDAVRLISRTLWHMQSRSDKKMPTCPVDEKRVTDINSA